MVLRFYRRVYTNWLNLKQQTTWDALARYEFFETSPVLGGTKKPIYLLVVGR